MKNSLILAFVCWLLVTAHSASAQIGISFTSIAPTCFGLTNGTATVTPNGGAAPYTYHWGNGQTGQTNQAIGAGTYAVTVTDINAQTASGSVVVMQPNQLTVSVTVSNVPCANFPDGGAVHAVITGGTAPYTVVWNDNNTEVSRQNLPAGTYSVTTTDAHNCTAVAQGIITVPPPLTVVVTSITPACGGLSNGSATILAVGGTPPYTHTWTPGGFTGTTVTGLAPGQYYVCTLDANNCQKDLWVTIPNIPNLDVTLVVNSAECTGVNNGFVTAFVNPPNNNYQYQWNLPPFTGVSQLTGLAPNTVVSVTVTDPLNGCTGTATTIVPAHSSIAVTVTDTDIPCAGQNVGSATAGASGGTAPYQYAWLLPPSGPQIGVGPTISGLAAGAYLVSVTDAHGCTAISGANISVLSDPLALIGATTAVVCDTAKSVIQFTNLSTDAYSTIVSWVWTVTTAHDTLTFINVNPLQLTLPVGVHGTVHLTVTSATGCVADTSKTFIVPGIPQISLSTGAVVSSCSNGPVHIIVSGGQPYYAYVWSPLTGLTLDSIPPNATANPAVTTTYQLIAADQGCMDTVSVTIIRGTPPTISVDHEIINTCDSTVLLVATANVPNVIWVNALGEVIGNPPGNPVTVVAGPTMVYTAIATDTSGCVDSVSVTVTGMGVDVEVDPNIPDIYCLGTDIVLGLINHHPGDTLQFIWTVTPPMTITGANTSMPTVTGPVGDYFVTVTVTNQYNCSDTLIIPIHIVHSQSIDDNISVDLCTGKKVSFFNNSGLLGVWYFGDMDSSLLVNPMHTYDTAGVYHVIFVPFDTVCAMPWDSLIHVQNMPLDTPIITHDYVICVDSAQIQFHGQSNGNIVSWHWTFSYGTPPTSNLQNPLVTFHQEGVVTATLTVTDINGCTATTTEEVPVYFISDHLPDTLYLCVGDSIYLNADGYDSTATYVWTSVPVDPTLATTNPNPMASPLVPTVYTVTISQDSLCSVTYQVTVIPAPAPDVDPGSPNMGCAGSDIPLWLVNNDPSQILTYQWSANPPLVLTGATHDTAHVVGPVGNYNVTVTVTNQYNCHLTLILPVMIDTSHNIKDSIYMDLCNGKTVHFYNNSGVLGVWYFGNMDSSLLVNPVHTYETAGMYHVMFIPLDTVCTIPWDSIIHVQETPLDTPIITHNYVICVDSAQIQFHGQSSGEIVSWHWAFSYGTPPTSNLQNPLVTFHQEGIVTATLTVTDINGCTATTTADVNVQFINDHLPDTLYLCVGDSVHLNADGHDSTATYVWTSIPVDPNLTTVNPNPMVSPLVPTVYTLTISQDSLCSVTYQVTVIPAPAPDVDPGSPNMGCAGSDIPLWLINNDPSQILTYQWSADPPLVLTGETYDTAHVVGPVGNYDVTVTVTNQYNCSLTLILPLMIDTSHNIKDSIHLDLCNGKTVSFFNNSGALGVWYFGDMDSSLLVNPVHTYDTAGLYHVQFIPLDTVCTMPWDSIIHVQDMPLDTPIITHNYVICIDSAQIQFNGQSNGDIVHWQWTFSYGTPDTSNLQNPVVTFHQEGIVTATLTVTDINGCTATTSADVNVQFISDHLPDTLYICVGDSVYLNADGYDSTATYVWTSVPVDPNLATTNPNPMVSPLVPTVYTVTISQDSLCTVTYHVTVIPAPAPDVDPGSPNMGCAGSDIPLWLINNDPSQILTYQWSADPPLVLTGATNDTAHVVGPVGNYAVTVTVTNQYNCSLTLILPVMIDTLHNTKDSIYLDLCNGKTVSFFNHSGALGVWYFGDMDSSLLANPVHTYDTAGIYHVMFIPLDTVCTMLWDSIIHVQDMPLDTPIITHNYVICIDSAQIQFNGQSNGDIVHWQWTFSYGTPDTSNLQNPLVTFHQEGIVTATLTVTDINGCTATTSADVNVQFISDHLPDTLYLCVGDSVYLNADGYDSTATYVWTSVPVDPNLATTNPNPMVSPLVPTVYTVTISQDSLCTVTYHVTVIPAPAPDVEPGSPNMGCADTDIPLWLINNDPSQILTYQWSADPPLVLTGATSDTAHVVGPVGNYDVSVTVTNQYNCSLTLILPVMIDTLHNTKDSIYLDLCNGKTVSFFNHSGALGVWYFGDMDSSLLVNPVHTYDTAGLYHVMFMPMDTVCTMPWDSIIHVQDMPLDTPIITHNYVICIDSAQIQFNGQSNGDIVHWHWTFSFGTPDTSNLQNPLVTFHQEGIVTATLTVTDINGCTATTSADVNVQFISDHLPDTLYLCVGDSVYLNADGYDSTATYVWTSVPVDLNLTSTNPNPMVSPLVPTIYTVTISQDSLCTVTHEVTVIPAPAPDVKPGSSNMGCAGRDIPLWLINNDPSQILTYHWSADPPLVLTSANKDTASVNGPVGNYDVTVTVTNQYNCSLTLILPLMIDTLHNTTDSIHLDLCNGKTVSFFNNSGALGVWYFGDLDSSLLANPVHTYDTAGLFHVLFIPLDTVCTMPWDSVIHVQDMPLDTPIITHNYVICIDSAQIQFNGQSNGDIVHWQWTFSFGTPDTSNLQNPLVTFHQEGIVTATLTVTDINGCTATTSADVNVQFISDHLPDTLYLCVGDSVYLNADGYDSTATYVWTSVPVDPNLVTTNPNPMVSPLVPTVYTVTISQDSLCTLTHPVTVIPAPAPNVEPGSPNMGCADTDIPLWLINNDPSQILTYQWSANPPLVLTGATNDTAHVVGPVGNYDVTVTVTNQYNCSLTLILPLLIDTEHNIKDSIYMDLCNGKTVSFHNNSGALGVWYFGDMDSSLLVNPVHVYDTAGLFHVQFIPLDTVCTMPWDSIIHVQDMPLDTPIITHDYVICVDSAQIQFHGQSNGDIVHWNWTFSAGTADSLNVQNPLVTFHEEDTIKVILVVTDINGCTARDTQLVVVTFVKDSIPAMLMFCRGDSVYLNANGFDSTATYVWTSVPVDSNFVTTDKNPIVSPAVPTVYTVHIYNQDTLCFATYQVTVVPKDSADLQLPPDMVVCNEDSVMIIAGGTGMNYEWSQFPTFDPIFATGPNITVFPTQAGQFYYVRTNPMSGCVGLDSIKIVNGQVNVQPEPYDNEICLGESTQLHIKNLDPSDDLKYQWSPPLPNVPDPVVSPTETTTYHVVVSNQYGCITELDFPVNVMVITVVAEIVGVDTICTDISTQLLATASGNGAPFTYSWSPATGLSDANIANPIATPNAAQVYVVTATSANGCTATDAVQLYFCTDECTEPYIFVPKAFTPNNDSNNDFFIVRGANITELTFIVWDRWGEKVYETTDLHAQGWDGTYKGKELTPDAYPWYVKVRCGNGQYYMKKGNVTLLK